MLSSTIAHEFRLVDSMDEVQAATECTVADSPLRVRYIERDLHFWRRAVTNVLATGVIRSVTHQ